MASQIIRQPLPPTAVTRNKGFAPCLRGGLRCRVSDEYWWSFIFGVSVAWVGVDVMARVLNCREPINLVIIRQAEHCQA